MRRQTTRWVRKAEADWAGARKLARIRPPLNDLVCFHCQQMAEKYLKAVMQEAGIPVPRTHNLDALLQGLLASDPALKSLRRALVSLSRFAVDYRYPGSSATARQRAAALRWAERVRTVLRGRLGLTP